MLEVIEQTVHRWRVIAHSVQRWLAEAHVETAYIAPGSPWENAYGESCNGKLCDELQTRKLFPSLADAKMLASEYRDEYNRRRPHSALEYQYPAEFAVVQLASDNAPLRLRQAARQPQPITRRAQSRSATFSGENVAWG